MFYSGKFSHPAHIYRKAKGGSDAWGDLPQKGAPDMPVLHGFNYSHTLEAVTIVPRTTEIQAGSPENAKRNYTGVTMYCSVYDDILSDDLVVYVDYAGNNQAFEVEGEGFNDYVSPYTGIEGGKEIFLGRVRHRR